MKTIGIGSALPEPVAPVLNDGSAEALQARADYEYAYMMWQMRQGGAEVRVHETTDFDAIQADFVNYKNSMVQWIHDMPETPDDNDPNVRGIPSIAAGSWSAIASAVASLGPGAGFIIPVLLIDLLINLGQELFVEWLAGKLFPGESGSMDELVKVFRKFGLIDPGIADKERSVLVGEKNGTGFAGLFQGDFASIGQLLYEALHITQDGEKVSVLEELLKRFTVLDADGKATGLLEKIFIVDDDGVERSVLEMGLLDTNANGKLFSLLWTLAQQQIRIVVSSRGDIDDVTIEP